ncbi:hypothetical protein [Pseudodesulfovibrio sp.]|uniref:hypothetical protein n=1 Tax=Pseudodesulfovibrio sp. TaxID=2035812 RepID=UPI002629A962|nr:hypothetical protein [Pseudodesulfovibrio sp.]MDD3311211.1 hypothetical protein [Pseudodesulfovibrio sp.]
MITNPKDVEKIRQLVREGKTIASVMENDFPEYEYWDIYGAAWQQDERSAMGVKRMIAYRLKWMQSASKAEQEQFLEEIDDLVWHLYERLKSNQKKLEGIRGILDGK